MSFRECIELFKLNRRAIGLAFANEWVTASEVEQSYDSLAESYSESWLKHLAPVTVELLEALPTDCSGPILDLGCGTGFTTGYLLENYPGSSIEAVDVSLGMLGQAGRVISSSRVSFVHGDMLEYLRSRKARSAGLIMSAWAIGYSHPGEVVRECGRVLENDGSIAFVVNYLDTLNPVFDAFKDTMLKFPGSMKRACRPRFPKTFRDIDSMLRRNDFKLAWKSEGRAVVVPSRDPEGSVLPWLLSTGVLAGFDSMLPLRKGGPEARYFEEMIARNADELTHHYVSVVARRTG